MAGQLMAEWEDSFAPAPMSAAFAVPLTIASMSVPDQGKDDDDGNGNAQQPKQYSATHCCLLNLTVQ